MSIITNNSIKMLKLSIFKRDLIQKQGEKKKKKKPKLVKMH